MVSQHSTVIYLFTILHNYLVFTTTETTKYTALKKNAYKTYHQQTHSELD